MFSRSQLQLPDLFFLLFSLQPTNNNSGPDTFPVGAGVVCHNNMHHAIIRMYETAGTLRLSFFWTTVLLGVVEAVDRVEAARFLLASER